MKQVSSSYDETLYRDEHEKNESNRGLELEHTQLDAALAQSMHEKEEPSRIKTETFTAESHEDVEYDEFVDDSFSNDVVPEQLHSDAALAQSIQKEEELSCSSVTTTDNVSANTLCHDTLEHIAFEQQQQDAELARKLEKAEREQIQIDADAALARSLQETETNHSSYSHRIPEGSETFQDDAVIITAQINLDNTRGEFVNNSTSTKKSW